MYSSAKSKEIKVRRLQQRSNQSRDESDDESAANRVGNGTTDIAGGVAIGWAAGVAGGSSIESLSKGLECGKVLWAALVTVDSEHHSGTAVAGLTAVSPDGRGVIDGKRPGGEVGGVSSNREETSVETDLLTGGLVGQGHTGGSERRLDNGVVLLLEDELDGVMRGSADTIGSVSEIPAGAANDDLDSVSGRSGRGWGGGGSVIIGRARRCGVLSIGLELGPNRKSSVLEVSERVGGTVSTTVDGGDHTGPTMAVWGVAALSAVHPDWLSVVNVNGKSWPVCRSNVDGDWLETRVKTTLFGRAGSSK